MKTCALLLSLLLTMAGCPAWAEGEVELVTGPDRRHEIDLRIEALDARRAAISTEGPQAATLLGLGATVIGTGMVFGTIGACDGCFDQGQPNYGALYAGVALFSIGAISGLTGGVIWYTRAHRRNEIDAERESLIEERDGLAAAVSRLELRSEYRNDTQFVTLGVRF